MLGGKENNKMLKVCIRCKKQFKTSKEGNTLCQKCKMEIYLDIMESRSLKRLQLKSNKKKN